MSKKKSKNIKALLGRLTILPAIIGLRGAKVDAINVVLIGAWVLWLLFDAVLTVQWEHSLVARVTKSNWVRLTIVGVVASVTACFACAVHIPALTDPEATENKYIRITNVYPPDKRFAHAILIEFGVTELNSEGLAVAVHYAGDRHEDWYGMPGRTDKQNNDIEMHYDGKLSADNPILRLNHETFQLTPRRSYYMCIMSNREMAEPEGILYFAVALNDRVISPRRDKLGHQYLSKR